MRRRGLQLDVRSIFATPTLKELAASVGGAVDLVQVPSNGIRTLTDVKEIRNLKTIYI
jgi:hypothetical protein